MLEKKSDPELSSSPLGGIISPDIWKVVNEYVQIVLKFGTENEYPYVGHLQLWQSLNMMKLKQITMLDGKLGAYSVFQS